MPDPTNIPSTTEPEARPQSIVGQGVLARRAPVRAFRAVLVTLLTDAASEEAAP
jgi:hypothetical protein